MQTKPHNKEHNAEGAFRSTGKRRILLVDDHAVLRSGLSELIDQEPDWEVCGEAEDIMTAMKLVKAQQPDLAVVDISLKDGLGLDLIKQVKSLELNVRILVLSMHDEVLFAERVLQAGAMGYINKQEPLEVILQAIRRVLGGRIYLSDRMTERLLHRVHAGESIAVSPIERLTDRELEVFEMIGGGMKSRDIAEKLHLSIKTIDTHRENIKVKLNLESSSELARRAVQWILENR